jgi:hypothetical protein
LSDGSSYPKCFVFLEVGNEEFMIGVEIDPGFDLAVEGTLMRQTPEECQA